MLCCQLRGKNCIAQHVLSVSTAYLLATVCLAGSTAQMASCSTPVYSREANTSHQSCLADEVAAWLHSAATCREGASCPVGIPAAAPQHASQDGAPGSAASDNSALGMARQGTAAEAALTSAPQQRIAGSSKSAVQGRTAVLRHEQNMAAASSDSCTQPAPAVQAPESVEQPQPAGPEDRGSQQTAQPAVSGPSASNEHHLPQPSMQAGALTDPLQPSGAVTSTQHQRPSQSTAAVLSRDLEQRGADRCTEASSTASQRHATASATAIMQQTQVASKASAPQSAADMLQWLDATLAAKKPPLRKV